jgi:hypothetical protein
MLSHLNGYLKFLRGRVFEAHLNEILVNSAAMAHSLKLPGSPTIRENGHDIEFQKGETASFGLRCAACMRMETALHLIKNCLMPSEERVSWRPDVWLEDNRRLVGCDRLFAAYA